MLDVSSADDRIVNSNSSVEVFEGIPCQCCESEKVAQELGKDNIVVIDRSGFYSPSYKPTSQLLGVLVSLKLQKASRSIFNRHSFHADYLIRWGKGDKMVKVFVSLKNRVIRTTTKSGSVLSSISKADASKLAKALALYDQSRP